MSFKKLIKSIGYALLLIIGMWVILYIIELLITIAKLHPMQSIYICCGVIFVGIVYYIYKNLI